MSNLNSITNDPRYQLFIERYALDCLRFAVEVVGLEPTKQQINLFNAVSKTGARVSVSSGHGTGKTTCFGVIGLWHLLCYVKSNCIVTGPRIETVRSGVWKEFAAHYSSIQNGDYAWLCDYMIIEHEKVYISGYKLSWWIVGKTAPKGRPENIAGAHNKWLLWLCDESSGIPDENFGVITGSLTDERNRMVLASQPTRPGGFFYETHHKLAAHNGGSWTAFVFNSEHSHLVSSRFLKDKLDEYGGRESAEFQIKVLGEFPESRDDYLLGRGAAEACINRSVIDDSGPYGLLLACDVGAGEYRDKSVAIIAKVTGDGDFGADARRVQIIAVPINTNTRHLQDFTGEVFRVASELENVTVLVDAGGMGVAVCQGLESMCVEVQRVKWGQPCFRTRNKERFFNLRAQAMVHASRAAKEGRLGIIDGSHRRDLLDQMSRVPFYFDEKARYVIERKDEMRKAGLPSPDLWDAISFCFLENAVYSLCEGRGTTAVSAIDQAVARAEAMFADV
mgnify:CR=1 FL=1